MQGFWFFSDIPNDSSAVRFLLENELAKLNLLATILPGTVCRDIAGNGVEWTQEKLNALNITIGKVQQMLDGLGD